MWDARRAFERQGEAVLVENDYFERLVVARFGDDYLGL